MNEDVNSLGWAPYLRVSDEDKQSPERSFAIGVSNTIKLFEISINGATNVSGIDDLYHEATGTPADVTSVTKRLVVDPEADLGIDPDNVERMGW